MKFDLNLRARLSQVARARKPLLSTSIEALEPRIAPAAVNPLAEVPNPGDLKIEPGSKTAFYHDLDGDIFLIKTTKGAFNDGLGANPNPTFLVNGGLIERIDVSFANFQTLVKGVAVGNFKGAAISAKVILPTAKNGLPLGGNGRMDVGYVNATGVDLASVTIPGDLTRIDAGDVNDKTSGLGTLSVQSMGTLGLATQASLAGSDAVKLTSNIHGKLNTLKVLATGKNIVHQGMQDVFIDVTAPDPDPKKAVINPSLGKIGSTSIDALVVTNNFNAVLVAGIPSYTPGTIRASGAVGAVSVGYSVAGGNSDYSGDIWSRTSIASVTLGGKAVLANPPAATLTGGAGFDSGAIFAGNPDTGAPAGKLGAVKINKVVGVAGSGNILGGGGVNSGTLYGDAGITSVLIAGDLQGGPVEFSGAIASGPGAPGVGVGLIGAVTVKGNILGAAGTNSGSIQSAAGITSVLVYGNEKGGTGDYSGSIVALGGNVKSITIKGELDTDPGAARDKTGIFVDGVLGSLLVGRINPGFGPGNATQYGAIVARGPVDKAGNVIPGTAIGAILVGKTVAGGAIVGDAKFIHIAAGFDHLFDSNNAGIPGAKNNPDASIGAVTIYGGVFATAITAGTSWGPNNNPGPDLPIGAIPTTDDAPLPFGQSVAKIASIFVSGAVTAGDVNTGDNTIFEAGVLGSVKIAGATAPAFPAGGALKQIQLFSHAYLLQIN